MGGLVEPGRHPLRQGNRWRSDGEGFEVGRQQRLLGIGEVGNSENILYGLVGAVGENGGGQIGVEPRAIGKGHQVGVVQIKANLRHRTEANFANVGGWGGDRPRIAQQG